MRTKRTRQFQDLNPRASWGPEEMPRTAQSTSPAPPARHGGPCRGRLRLPRRVSERGEAPGAAAAARAVALSLLLSCRRNVLHAALQPLLDALPDNVKALGLRRACRSLRAALDGDRRVDASEWAPLWALREVWGACSEQQRQQLARTAGRCGDFAAAGWMAWEVAGLWEQSSAAAARAGQLGLLQHMAARGFSVASLPRHAVAGGHVDVLRWLQRQQPPRPWDADACANAAEGGHVDVLRWLRAQQPLYPWDARACAGAAAGGHLDVLRWLRAQQPPCPWDATACARAAEGGHLDVLQWLRAQQPPCPWDAWACASAAAGGHLDVLRWLRAQQPPCPWDATACTRAAGGGHLDVLQWLRAQEPPCPWDCQTVYRADANDHAAVLKWAIENGCETDSEPETDSETEDGSDD